MLDELSQSLALIISQTQNNFHNLAIIISIPWLIYLISLINTRILYLGIIPRKIYGLPGIFFAPLLHANFNHIFFNTIPLIVFSNFLLINGVFYFVFVTVAITLMSGLLIWCFASSGIHLGASALISGYWGLLVSNIVQHGTLTAIIIGVISPYYFAGIFLGIFPGKKGISWEGHLFGLLAGLAVSFFLNWKI